MNVLAPIVLFVYNRPLHTQATLEYLEKNDLASGSELFIFADGKKENISSQELNSFLETQKIINQKWRFQKICVVEREKNYGLADNITAGVTQIVAQYGRVIVLEDDLLTSKFFLKYMNDALNYYENEPKVMHISGYTQAVGLKLPQTFFYNMPSSWGWATWQRAWQFFEVDIETSWRRLNELKQVEKFDLDGSKHFRAHIMLNINGERKTWAIRWCLSVFFKGGFCLLPQQSLVKNIGFDSSGETKIRSNFYQNEVFGEAITVGRVPIKEHKKYRKIMRDLYCYGGTSFAHKCRFYIEKLKAMLK